MARTVDTNLIARGGPEGQRWAAAQAAGLLAQGLLPAPEAVEALDREMIRRNLSPADAPICWPSPTSSTPSQTADSPGRPLAAPGHVLFLIPPEGLFKVLRLKVGPEAVHHKKSA